MDPWRSKATKDGSKSVLRSPAITKPGECVAVDQIISAQPGLVPQDKGSLTRARIWGCTVFVDYATSLVNVVLMRDLSAESTLAAKQEFEEKCATKGVTIKHYHADNGRFAEPAWKEDCKAMSQKLTFCGVGAHHQNAIVERKIKDLTLTGRTLLLHAMRYWPEYISQILWPFAVKCAEDRINNLQVDLNGMTAEMRFSDSPTSKIDLRNYHTFGCPCYILDSRVQSNPKGLPKWEPRARLGIYLGHSPAHAGSVALVMNPKTGLVSPQFHVVFDDTFSTVPHIRAGTTPPNWEQLVRNSSELSTDQDYDLTRTWFEATEDPADGAIHLRYMPVELVQDHLFRHIVTKLLHLFSDIPEEGVARPPPQHHNCIHRHLPKVVHCHRCPGTDGVSPKFPHLNVNHISSYCLCS